MMLSLRTRTTADDASPAGRPERRARRRAAREARRRERLAKKAQVDRFEAPATDAPVIDIPPGDPLLEHLRGVGEPVDVEKLDLDSAAVRALREAGVKLLVPLVAQGELIGTLNLGPRLSDQEYSGDDRKLLENLAAQAAPAVRVAQMIRERQSEARERQRIEQELEVAKLIQQNFLPKELPRLDGWSVEAYYRPAREVGGDFYDFVNLSDGRIGIVIGDVTDKGVPAAMVMAATRSVLRAAAQRFISPGRVLERANELLVPDMPPKMFVTCLYGVLDPATGMLRYANAGHNVPYVRAAGGAEELRARGMPLGLMPGMAYEELTAEIEPDQIVLLHSDGLAEAHAPDAEMFGFERLRGMVAAYEGGRSLIDTLLEELDRFTGPGHEQEDDVTLLALHRTGGAREQDALDGGEALLAEFSLPSEEGGERGVMDRVAASVEGLGIPPERLDRLKTAVAETAMNAMEHGNAYEAETPVTVRVLRTGSRLRVRIADRGGRRAIADADPPDLDAKLEGAQPPRGWGLFLIEHMVDEVRTENDGDLHTVELVMDLEEGDTR